jgi:hypothetical protein
MDGSASIDDLTAIYPSDIYSANAARYYGHGDDKLDNQAIRILNKIKGNPNAKVKIYRSIPKDINADINEGDWVTITKQYAVEHGENRFDGKYKILEKEVKASDIITDGSSIHEQGYDPKEFKAYANRAIDELELNPKFNYLIGKQSIVEQTKNTNKTIGAVGGTNALSQKKSN